MGVRKKIKKLRVPTRVVFKGKSYKHHSGAAFSKSFRDFIVGDLKKTGYKTRVRKIPTRGYQIYKRKTS